MNIHTITASARILSQMVTVTKKKIVLPLKLLLYHVPLESYHSWFLQQKSLEKAKGNFKSSLFQQSWLIINNCFKYNYLSYLKTRILVNRKNWYNKAYIKVSCLQSYGLLLNLAHLVTAGWLPKRNLSLTWFFLCLLFHLFMPKPWIWI